MAEEEKRTRRAALDADRRRGRREWITVLVTLVVIVLLTVVQTKVVDLKGDLPVTSSILVFAIININAILILLLLFLVVRNLVKLIFERRRKLLGSKLKTKLVVAFVSLSLVPTILLFFVSTQFITTSIEYWFSIRIERSLTGAVEVGQSFTRHIGSNLIRATEGVAKGLDPVVLGRPEALKGLIESQRATHHLSAIQVYGPGLRRLAYATRSGVHIKHLAAFPAKILRRALKSKKALSHLQPAPTGDFISAVGPVLGPGKRPVAVVVVSRILPAGLAQQMDEIARGLRGYNQLKNLEGAIKLSHYITLTLVTLLTFFFATWFGFFMAKGITVPIQELAEGTKRIAGGDYDFHIDLKASDEVGVLVDSFNRMTLDLKTSKALLTDANQELQDTNLELDQRRRYMEIVLRNVAAGVISVDGSGIIRSINTSAERMLGLNAENAVGRPYTVALTEQQIKIVGGMIRDRTLIRQGAVERTVRVTMDGEDVTLLVNISLLQDESGADLGMVVVFDDTTHIEKAQRMAAWREVARRIAHEVKNPLTPIKLSAQRLKRRYSGRLGDDAALFDECIQTIVNQTDELKLLVDEFSNFARMPSINPQPASLSELCQEAVALYQEAHPGLTFSRVDDNELPMTSLDKEQMKRVLFNLFDNAVHALDGEGTVELTLTHISELGMIRLEVADDGPGIPAEDKGRLFEPYFSTKRSGTGLGLAIVSTIVSDHNGYIRVRDNEPKGTRFIIELPVRS